MTTETGLDWRTAGFFLLLALCVTPKTSDFLQVPSPSELIVTLKERHTYYCHHSQTDEITWQLNGSRIVNFRDIPTGVSPDSRISPDGGTIYTLTIGGLSKHNGTTIQCVAGTPPVVTPAVTFLIQGQ